jgi:ketosteroid isomerase-like protein
MRKSLLMLLLICSAFIKIGFSQDTTKPSPPKPEQHGESPTSKPAETPKKDPMVEPRARRATTTSEKPKADKSKVKASMSDPTPSGVVETFKALFEGIRNADVETVMSIYWESPQLIVFNNNGTITRSWEQVRANRARLYKEMKDVKLEERDLNVQMIGRDGAVVTCLWTQSQNFRGAQETSQGRLTLVFRRVEGAWKVIHAHTSSLAPNPAGISPSESETPSEKSEAGTKPASEK